MTKPLQPLRDYTIALTTLKQADPILGALIDQVGHCKLDQAQHEGDLLSSLARSIIYQQLSGKAAATIHRRFLGLYPDKPYPNATDILHTPDDVLRSTGVSRAKALYLKDLAQKVVEGLPSLDDLTQMDDETIVQTLTSIKGIGRWTVQMLLIFRLHRWDVLPADDLGIRTGIRKIYTLPDLPDRKTVERIGAPWQPYRTIASWYLWRSLDLPQPSPTKVG